MLGIVGAAAFAQSGFRFNVSSLHILSEFALLAWVLYAPRYMRRRVSQAENPISLLLPDGKREFDRLFGGISDNRPPMIIFVLFFVLVFFISTPPFGIGDLAFGIVLALGVSSTVWAYYSASKGIHDMGTVSLNLPQYFTDPLLGLRPVGGLALSLAGAYFAATALGLLSAISYNSGISAYVAVGVLVLLGLVFFFLSLMQLHRHMLHHKTLETKRVSEKIGTIFRIDSEAGDRQTELTQMFKLEMMERKIASMATWPFDLQILGRLLVIFFSVSAVLIARIIAYYLNLFVPLG